MVEYSSNYDAIFMSLADATRRDILQRLLSAKELTISEIATTYTLSFAAISKHIMLLEKAKLVYKQKRGRTQVVALNASTMSSVQSYIEQYEALWNDRFDALETFLNKKEG